MVPERLNINPEDFEIEKPVDWFFHKYKKESERNIREKVCNIYTFYNIGSKSVFCLDRVSEQIPGSKTVQQFIKDLY